MENITVLRVRGKTPYLGDKFSFTGERVPIVFGNMTITCGDTPGTDDYGLFPMFNIETPSVCHFVPLSPSSTRGVSV